MNNNILAGCILAKLIDICQIVPTGVSNYLGKLEYYSTGSIKDGLLKPEGRYEFKKRPSRANRISKVNDVFQARMKDSKKSILINKSLSGKLFSTGFIQLRSFNTVDMWRFLYYYVQSPQFVNQRDKYATGTTQVALTDTNLKKIEILIPSIQRQYRIVSKIEEIFSISDSIKKSLKENELKLTEYQDSILLGAFNGNLTEKWRKKHHSTWSDVLLENILQERGIFDGPFGSNLKTKDYTDSGVRVIRLENIKKLEFDESKKSFISIKKYQTLKKHTVNTGDIIFGSFIDSEVRCCFLPKLEYTAINKADCFCIRPNEEQILTKFLMMQLCSPQILSKLRGKIHGATRDRVNTKQIRALMIRLCSLEEQQEIVSILESHLSVIKNLKTEIRNQIELINRFNNIILKLAYGGKLVPEESNDEPPEILLEIIKKEKEKIIKRTKQKRVRKC